MKFSKTPIFKLRSTGLILLSLGLIVQSHVYAAIPPKAQEAFVSEALTGDTVRLKGGKILKYAGLQAPPLQSIVPLVREYGENALKFNKSLVENKRIWIEWGPQIRDTANNLIGYVFLEDGSSVNLQILSAGHAKTRITPPNIQYAGNFRKAELEAMRQKRGLWVKEPDNPFIKSEYVGEKSTKIFYFPTSPELGHIPEAHLIRFRSRIEAIAAGYKPCPTCREGEKDLFAQS